MIKLKNITFLFLFISLSSLFAQKSIVTVVNNTPYNITLRGQTGNLAKIESGFSTNLNFSINSSSGQNAQHLYISYDIPIANYNITVDADVRTVVLDSGNETLTIREPENLKFNSYFIAIKNTSDNSIEIRTAYGTTKVLYSRVGQIYIPMTQTGVYQHTSREPFKGHFISDGFKKIEFREESNYENGKVYFYKYNGRNVVLEDIKSLDSIFDDSENIYKKSLDLYNNSLTENKKNNQVKMLEDANSLIDKILIDNPNHSKYRKLKNEIDNLLFEITKKKISSDAPSWTSYAYNDFDKEKYFAAVGIGNSANEAYNNAKNEIYSIFGVVDNKNIVISRSGSDIPRYYRIMQDECLKKHGRSTELDDLLDLKKSGEYYDKKLKKYYVAVVVEKNYFALERNVDVNNKDINEFFKKANSEQDYLKKLSYLMPALMIANENISLAEKLNIIAPDSNSLKDIKNGDFIQSQIDELISKINFSINLEHDNGQIKSAIVSVLDMFDIPVVDYNSIYSIKDKLAYETPPSGSDTRLIIIYTHEFAIFNNSTRRRIATLTKKNGTRSGLTEDIVLQVVKRELVKDVTSDLEQKVEDYFKSIIL